MTEEITTNKTWSTVGEYRSYDIAWRKKEEISEKREEELRGAIDLHGQDSSGDEKNMLKSIGLDLSLLPCSSSRYSIILSATSIPLAFSIPSNPGEELKDLFFSW